ncbi:UNVERIFIED_CONTAM: hypothetical protein K2H54_033931 [Gekko kuhli]
MEVVASPTPAPSKLVREEKRESAVFFPDSLPVKRTRKLLLKQPRQPQVPKERRPFCSTSTTCPYQMHSLPVGIGVGGTATGPPEQIHSVTHTQRQPIRGVRELLGVVDVLAGKELLFCTILGCGYRKPSPVVALLPSGGELYPVLLT